MSSLTANRAFPVRGAVVTGVAGFLGSHLAESLLRQGIPVWGLDNLATGLRSNVDLLRHLDADRKLFHFAEADVCSSWRSWFAQLPLERISHVFHFASPASPPKYQKIPTETFWANVLGLREAIDLARVASARVVFASSSEVYGDPLTSPQPESYWGNTNPFGPRSCYDEAKRAGEALIYSHNRQFGTRHGCLRIFNTYGPRMNPTDGRVIVNFLMQAHRGEALTVYGDGHQTRSFCYVDDLIQGILLYAERDLVEPLNLGNDSEFSILQLAAEVRKLFPERSLPLVHEPLSQDDPKRRRPDLARARDALAPWSPRTSLHEGLRRMSQWVLSVR